MTARELRLLMDLGSNRSIAGAFSERNLRFANLRATMETVFSVLDFFE